MASARNVERSGLAAAVAPTGGAAKSPGWRMSMHTATNVGGHMYCGDPDTVPELAQFLASKGLNLVPFTGERKPDPQYMTLDLTDLKKLKAAEALEAFRNMKRSWPNSPYIQAEGPSLQLERINITQSQDGCLCCKPWGPVRATDMVLHFRPADPGMGSAFHKTYRHAGCGPVMISAQSPNTTWEFVADDGDKLQFVLEVVRKGMCGCGAAILPNEGRIWTLRRGQQILASIEVPAKQGCCDRGARVWLRVKKEGGDAVFAIREMKPLPGPCCGCDPCVLCDCPLPCAGCCDRVPCGHMCTVGCGCGPRGCSACCAIPQCAPGGMCATCEPWAAACGCGQLGCRGGCCFNPKACCREATSVKVFADAGGIVSMTKREGETIKIHNGEAQTHDIVQKVPPTPAIAGIPPQQVMIVWNLEGKAGVPARPGWETHFSAHVDQALDSNVYFRVQEVFAKQGQQETESQLVAILVEDKHCCGFLCLPDCIFCPSWGIGSFCVACCAAGRAACCSLSSNPEINYDLSPVTGEWATPDGAPEYRVRGEVHSTKAVGKDGRSLLSKVVAGLEIGTDAQVCGPANLLQS